MGLPANASIDWWSNRHRPRWPWKATHDRIREGGKGRREGGFSFVVPAVRSGAARTEFRVKTETSAEHFGRRPAEPGGGF